MSSKSNVFINTVQVFFSREIENFGFLLIPTDDEMPTPGTPNVFSLISEYELLVSDPPNVFNSIPESESTKIGEKEVAAAADHEVPTSDIPNVPTLLSDYEVLVTDSAYVFSPIPETEPSKIGKDEVTDHVVPVTDTLNVFNPIPESEPANMGKKEVTDYEFSTSDIAMMSSPTPVYETRGKELTGRKHPISDISHVFVPTFVSELDHMEDKKITAHKPPKFSLGSISELGNKEDEEFTDYEFPTSDTPHVRSPTPVQPQFGSTGKKDLTESDPPSDSPSIITSKPVRKPDTKQRLTGIGD
ncbi:hypothetical protein scyTo_0003351 [Scyliorhinus torazame]|uniref:Uncharacterized protein n=1 Tax=Scyliorhinus torazame TaxID=75743 RepID=A0A401PM90_SCYTO|nr:hypothetical protein [Scyliorhinus torazame]